MTDTLLFRSLSRYNYHPAWCIDDFVIDHASPRANTLRDWRQKGFPLLPDFTAAQAIMLEAIPRVAPAAQLVVYWRGESVLERSYGWLDPETRQQPVDATTLFDLASLSKLFVATTFMTLVDAGTVTLDQPIARVLPELEGMRAIQPYEDPLIPGGLISVAQSPGFVDGSAITFRHVLSHTSGLPAWRPLFRQGSRAAAWQMALTTTYAYPTGTQVVYSDIGLILLGLAIERLTGSALDRVVAKRVTEPLGFAHTRYLAVGTDHNLASVAPTEVCGWRRRRVMGEVHDENAASLGGVAGHAGVFSTAADVAAFGQVFLDNGRPLLRAATVGEMTREQALHGSLRRGLGFVLWSPDPEASGNPLSQRAFGHTGFTGTSLWIDPQRSLVVALLTNDIYYGRLGRGIGSLRVALHRTIVEAIDQIN
jgi:CubicO group peptidase (beta-lactamase class C family)